jgi:hypothetical protein|tara:strand:+ start:185 stop:400 length:216 start_codon:yes stop_codon:yes gene_type:complete
MSDKKDTPPLKDVFSGLTDEQFEALKEAIKAGKKGYTYDTKTGQYGFKMSKGGLVTRGVGAVSRERRFKIY